MDMTTALTGLGVTATSIDDETRERLDRDGYAPLTGVVPERQLAAMRARLAELLASEGERAGLEVHQEAGTDRLADLVNKDPVFDICFTDPRLLACVQHVLGEFKLSSLNFRAALPGEGLQALHAEGGPVTDPASYQVCNSIWLLDDFTADNGATRVVPGSHRSGKSPGDEMPDTRAAHPDEVLLRAPPEPSSSSTATCGTAARSTARRVPAGRCTPTSPAAATPSNSISGDTSARRRWPGSARPPGSSSTSRDYVRSAGKSSGQISW